MGLFEELGGHLRARITYANAIRFYYWPGIFHWFRALTADCFACPNNRPKPKHPKEVLLDERQGHTAPFCALDIDHKGLLHPRSNRTEILIALEKLTPFRVS